MDGRVVRMTDASGRVDHGVADHGAPRESAGLGIAGDEGAILLGRDAVEPLARDYDWSVGAALSESSR